jgi:hypothetical protein
MEEFKYSSLINEICHQEIKSFRKAVMDKVPNGIPIDDFLNIMINCLSNIQSNLISHVSTYLGFPSSILYLAIQKQTQDWFDKVEKDKSTKNSELLKNAINLFNISEFSSSDKH